MGRFPEGEAAVIDASNDPGLTSWCASARGSDFPIQNIPFGVGSRDGVAGTALTRVGDQAIDLFMLWDMGLIPAVMDLGGTEYMGALNSLLLSGPEPVRMLRSALSKLFRAVRSKDDDFNFGAP